MTPHLAMLCRPGPALDCYTQVLTDLGCEFYHCDNLDQLFAHLMEEPTGGILLDLRSLLRSTPGEKVMLHAVLERFPALQLNYNPNEDFLACLPMGLTPARVGGLPDFLAYCEEAFFAKTIRVEQRLPVNARLRYARAREALTQDPRRAFTGDLSLGGCFVVTCRDLDLDSPLWLELVDCPGVAPLELSLRWRRPWSGGQGVPGVGGAFIDASPEQLAALERLLAGEPSAI